MKLSNIESKNLLPRFASKISWIMNALDSLIKTTADRVKSIDAPLTMEAIEACTDEELEALYNQYGVAKYYPDLSRPTRNKMLYEMCRIYRYLGTPKAVETLCNYIFDGVELNVTVLDNLAFDTDGNLIDVSLLDVFDVEVNPTEPILNVSTNARILANIIRFSRNSQYLRYLLYEFEQDFTITVSPCGRSDNPQVTQSWIQDSLCVPYTPAYTEITLYMASGQKQAQKQVTSDFIGDVNTTYCYALYTDPELTTLWNVPFINGYDYSNDYELGVYVDGSWVPIARQHVSELPDSYTTDSTQWKIAYILMDDGYLWLASNVSGSGYMAISAESIHVRIYPKGYQVFSLYLYASATGKYGNRSLNSGGASARVMRGNLTNVIGSRLPSPVIDTAYTSSGLAISGTYGVGYDSQSVLRVSSNPTHSLSCLTYRLGKSIYFAFFNPDKSNKSNITYNTLYVLYDENGNQIEYDDNYVYTPVQMFKRSGSVSVSAGNVYNTAYFERSEIRNITNTSSALYGKAAFISTFSNISTTFQASYLWYTKEPIT